MKQRGFIQLSILAWAAIAAGAVILALGVAVKVQTSRLEASEARYGAFVAQTRALGEAQEAKTKERIAHDEKLKSDSDAENKRTTERLMADIKRLRDARAGGGYLPPAPAGAKRPDLVTLDRAELERAIRELDTGVQGLVDEGSKATVDLNTAKAWAQAR